MIRLPVPLHRRDFLAAMAATGGLSIPMRALADRKHDLKSVSFAVVSDTHLGRRDRDTARKQWEKTAAELANAKIDFVLHLGDVVDGGRESQYPVYLKTRKTIGKPVFEIPGNHDPQKLFEKHIRSPVDTAVDRDWLRLVLLNNSRTTSHDGFLSDKQLAWIEQQCADAARSDRYVCLCMHVPAHSNRHPDRGWHVKKEHGQTRLYEIVAKHSSRVLCLMHGHFHNGIRGWDDRKPVHEIVFPSALYNLNRRLTEQKAAGYNLSEFRPGYTLVEIKAGVMTLTYKPVGAAASATKALRRT